MRTVAQSVTGERVIGSIENEALQSRFASARVTPGVGANAPRGMSRAAQMQGSNITTAPNFYSPFLTPTAYQIPNARREVYLWSNWWRNNEPKIAAAINFYKMFPFSGWKLECSSSYVKDYFEKLIQKLNFQKWLPEISGVYHLFGDAFVLSSIDCEHCSGSNLDENGELCEHNGATWSSIAILNPDSVHIMPGLVGQPGTYLYQPNEREMRLVSERQSHNFYDTIPEAVRNLIRKGEPIKLNPICIEHFKFGSSPWEDYGTPMIRPLFPTLAYKDKLRNAQWLVAERHILPVKVAKVGSENRPANQSDLDNIQEELAAVANDPNLTLVTHHAFDFDYVGASGKVLQLTNEFELIDQEILDGVMLNKALLNGEGPTYGNAQVGLLAMAQRLETFRREVARWIEEKIFKPVSQWNGFVIEGERGQEEIVYPKIKFDDLQLRDETGKLQMMVTANTNGVISNYTLIEAFGLNPDQEIERLREEQGANFIQNPSIGNTDLGNGFAGGMGAGFGGGMPSPMGGAAPPPMGGKPGIPGMPPAGGGMPPVGAANVKDNYRTAIRVVNDIYAERQGIHDQDIATRTASKTVKSQAHREFLKSIQPVTGRGIVGPLPEHYDGFGNPLDTQAFGGAFCFPVNQKAMIEWNTVMAQAQEDALSRQALAAREVIQKRVAVGKKGKKDDPNAPQSFLFTSIEKKLYYLLTSLNLPFAIYAQYSMGATGDYTLDAAIPSLRLGLEADGEMWHNSPEKIARDKRRDMELSANGWTILRFTDKELNDRPNEVAQVIMQAIRQLSNPGTDGSGKTVL
jgi:very-short-patch-repair endonuclease